MMIQVVNSITASVLNIYLHVHVAYVVIACCDCAWKILQSIQPYCHQNTQTDMHSQVSPKSCNYMNDLLVKTAYTLDN